MHNLQNCKIEAFGLHPEPPSKLQQCFCRSENEAAEPATAGAPRPSEGYRSDDSYASAHSLPPKRGKEAKGKKNKDTPAEPTGEAEEEAAEEVAVQSPHKRGRPPKKEKGPSRQKSQFFRDGKGTPSAAESGLKTALAKKGRGATDGGALSTPPPEGPVAEVSVRDSLGQEQASPSETFRFNLRFETHVAARSSCKQLGRSSPKQGGEGGGGAAYLKGNIRNAIPSKLAVDDVAKVCVMSEVAGGGGEGGIVPYHMIGTSGTVGGPFLVCSTGHGKSEEAT